MACALPYEARSFDAVVSTLAFHHLALDQMDRTLSEIRRALRPSGTVCPLPGPHLTDQLIGTSFGGMTESIATIVGEE
jgi:ubiquinone/menaquinone biosynthesis C-methylase UbiE